MWPFFNFQKTFDDLARAAKRGEEKEQIKLIKRFIRFRRTSVKKLIKTLGNSLFNADIWVNEPEWAAQILMMPAQHKLTRRLVIKKLEAAANDTKGYYCVRPQYILNQIGS
jgi:hypothetical protein